MLLLFAATIFEALLNIVILPHYAKKIALNAGRPPGA
jgi:hypothetical protein